jgi:hypothetical protein
MHKDDIPERVPTAELIPGWHSLMPSVQVRIESQINAEWWRGWYEGREAERVESRN